ncbi:hypothetical protein BKA64DRAFT_647153 [Cadophora sp. MPI-SDFR-AT-0126]|nr:hypothetical protein BKA64DRAFT_647153 [Leotiomycetes sp. MPI-SDFR-AT-0126]
MEAFPVINIPTFTIIRGEDHTFHFDPPHGSVALINALAIRYPLEPNLESQMRRALLEFIATESQDEPISRESPPPTSYDSGGTSSSPILPTPPFRELKSDSPELPKPRQQQTRRKSQYTVKKRQKVAEVRKRGACEYHREKKLECNCIFQNMDDTTAQDNIDRSSYPSTGGANYSAQYTLLSPQPEKMGQQDEHKGNNFSFYNLIPNEAPIGEAGDASQVPDNNINYFPSTTHDPTPSMWSNVTWP